jgi:PilZ domain
MGTETSERRRAPRIPTSGRVEISFEDPTPITIKAELVETSATGFRIEHGSPEISPGLEIRLSRAHDTVRAKVVWTHLLEGRRVSGCVLI